VNGEPRPSLSLSLSPSLSLSLSLALGVRIKRLYKKVIVGFNGFVGTFGREV